MPVEWARGAARRLVAWLFGSRAAPRPAPLLAPLDTQETRVAVHECGHAVVAWYCSDVAKVELVTTLRNGDALGYVRFAHSGNRWTLLAVTLAGAAAEVFVHGKVKSAGAGPDLLQALNLARLLRGQSPPWGRLDGPTLPFRRMYDVQLDEADAGALEAAYRMARRVLVAHQVRFYRLIGALMSSHTLSERDVGIALGGRAFVRALNVTGSRFVL